MSYKRIPNTAGGNSYKDIRVFEPNNNTNYLEAELINYELEDAIKAVENTFNIKLVIKKGPCNE